MNAKALARGFCLCIEFVEAFGGVISIAIAIGIAIAMPGE